jgi:GNAT superfamily N-acetyltransferase
MDIKVRQLTIDLWPALEDLFGSKGACNGCWCMYWRIGSDYQKRSRDLNKKDFREIVKKGPPPGLIAFIDNLPVGWCQLTTKNFLPWLEENYSSNNYNISDIWCISCFYVRSRYRKMGVTSALIDHAIKFAKRSKAKLIEAYPRNSVSSYTGYPSTFRKAGFKVTGHGKYDRTVMRLYLE